MLVNRAGAQCRPDVAGDKFLPQIFDISSARAGGKRFLSCCFQIFLLAEIANHGNHFAAVILLEPGNNDGGVQTSGVRKYNFFRQFVLLVLVNSAV